MPDNETPSPVTPETSKGECPRCGMTHELGPYNKPFEFDDRGVAQLPREESTAFATEKRWETMTAQEIVDAQLYQRRLFIPEKIFRDALSTVLGRKVEWQELSFQKQLVREVKGEKSKPSRKDKNDMIVALTLDEVAQRKRTEKLGAKLATLLSMLSGDIRKSEVPEGDDPIGDLLEAIGAEKLIDADGIQAYSLGTPPSQPDQPNS